MILPTRAPSTRSARVAPVALALVVGLLLAGPGGAPAGAAEGDAPGAGGPAASGPQGGTGSADATPQPQPGTGTVLGQVFDGETGQPVPGVTVILAWPEPAGGDERRQEVQVTNDEGAFRFPKVPAGTYDVRFRKSGYRDSTMTNFEVRAGQVNRADFPLPVLPTDAAREILQLEEFVAEASVVEDEVVELEMRMESDELLNIMGEEELSKFAAGDVAEALERVAGVTVAEGQFAVIRGLEDRYNSTLYNGAPVPSPDPDRQSVQLDLFPSDVVGNLVVLKTFAPHLPSNSSGGAVDILTHSYPDEIEFKLKAGTGYNDNAKGRFLILDGSTDPELVVEGVDPELDLATLQMEGISLIEGNPVGREDEKTGNFFDDLENVIESDYVISLGGRKEFEDREFRFKGVLAREKDYSTAEGFDEDREPRPPLFGEGSRFFDPGCFCFVTIPGELERSGDLTLGELNLSGGRFDLTASQRDEQTTAFGAFGFDLDDEGNHRLDASVFWTRKEEEVVRLKENGFIPGLGYGGIAQAQINGTFDNDPDGNSFIDVATRGSSIARSFRNDASEAPGNGSLSFGTFTESTSFERDRELTIYQINGDHTFRQLPGLHFSWATNWATTDQEEVSLGSKFFYEPCGFNSVLVLQCPEGTQRLDVDTIFPADEMVPAGPPMLSDLGPGSFIADNRLTLSANIIEESSRFTRFDVDYEMEFSPQSVFTVAGGVWMERAERNVESAFLENGSVDRTSEFCGGGASSQFFCRGATPLELGRNTFTNLGIRDGKISGLRTTTNESTREIDAWHLRGKITFWDRLDLLAGYRFEDILIESENDPFIRDPETGEIDVILGGPNMFPTRYLFFDRLDNPFTRMIGADSVIETDDLPGEGFVFNDQLLGIPQTPMSPCDGAGSDPEDQALACVDFLSQEELLPLVNGEIDESRNLPSFGVAFRPIEGLSLRGAYSQTVARPSFRELGYYVSVEPGSDDLIVGNPQLGLSDVESWDARVEYVWGRGNLFAVSGFIKEIERPIESIIVRNPLNAEEASSALFRTFFNNPDTADLRGVETEGRLYLDFIPNVPGWLQYVSIGGNFTYIDAEVDRTEAELARSEAFFGLAPGDEEVFTELAPSRRLFNQPEWIANADISFDHPDWGTQLTVAWFAISDRLDAAGTASVANDGQVDAFTLDRYVDAYNELRVVASQDIRLPGELGKFTLKFSGKNLTDTKRRIIYDPEQTDGEIAEREVRIGRDYSISLTYTREF